MDSLPHWSRGTPAVLCSSGPHAIPVSTAVRAADRRVLVALGGEREMLARLREDGRAALCMLGEGIAFTAHGEAAVLEHDLEAAPGVVVVELRVGEVQDHLADGRTELLDGARWRWREKRFADADRELIDELEQLAAD